MVDEENETVTVNIDVRRWVLTSIEDMQKCQRRLLTLLPSGHRVMVVAQLVDEVDASFLEIGFPELGRDAMQAQLGDVITMTGTLLEKLTAEQWAARGAA